jgi:hypothetical protein
MAQVPALQHDVWHVPSPEPPQLPLHDPFAPQVGVAPMHGPHVRPQWLLSKATHVKLLQQPPLHSPGPAQGVPHV